MTARAHLESLLRDRKLDVTLTTAAGRAIAPTDDRARTGLAELDARLGGGLRRGHVSEIVGPRSAGRSTLLCALLAAAATRGEAVALVDTCDRFDPASAAARDLDLAQLLWVRERGDATRALKALSLVLQAGHFGLVALDLSDIPAAGLRTFPFTTWLRVARTIEGSQTVALILGTEHIARSPGGVTIALERPSRLAPVTWHGTSARARLLGPVTLHPRIVTATAPSVSPGPTTRAGAAAGPCVAVRTPDPGSRTPNRLFGS